MINNRLVWLLEISTLISREVTSGIRKSRSTMDHFGHFETFVKEVFFNGIECVVTILVDFEKAYYSTWKYSTIKDVYVT